MEMCSLVVTSAKLASEPQPHFPVLPGLLIVEAADRENDKIVPDPHLVVLVPHLLEDGQRCLDQRGRLVVLAQEGAFQILGLHKGSRRCSRASILIGRKPERSYT